MSFKLYAYVLPNQEDRGRGEYWRGEEFGEHLALTQYQTILPTILSFLPKQGRIGEMLYFVKEAGFEVLLVEPDDFIPPKSLGLYVDWAWLIGNRRRQWELNTLGKILRRFLSLFPLWLYCSSILLVARKYRG